MIEWRIDCLKLHFGMTCDQAHNTGGKFKCGKIRLESSRYRGKQNITRSGK